MPNTDEQYMKRALELASLARGKTSPNPMVGAVIVKNGRIVGEGYHQKAGTPHAEVHAIAAAGEQTDGADLYVSLEPCCHYGKTPPCTEAIISAGIKKVVAAVTDPNPKVAGQGLRVLRKAGIETEVGVLEAEALRLNEIFIKYITTGMPFVSLKTAMTLDGKIASYSGDSQWVTGDAARAYVHRLRNSYDAILVGIGTVLADNPRLNTRLGNIPSRDPVRVIIDEQLKMPMDSTIVKTSREQRTLVFCSQDCLKDKIERLESLGIEIYPAPDQNGQVSLRKVMEKLAEMQICSVLVEGGAEINASLLNEQLADKVYWFIAPKIIGGRRALSPVGGMGTEKMSDARVLKSYEICQFEKDLLVTGYL